MGILLRLAIVVATTVGAAVGYKVVKSCMADSESSKGLGLSIYDYIHTLYIEKNKSMAITYPYVLKQVIANTWKIEEYEYIDTKTAIDELIRDDLKPVRLAVAEICLGDSNLEKYLSTSDKHIQKNSLAKDETFRQVMSHTDRGYLTVAYHTYTVVKPMLN